VTRVLIAEDETLIRLDLRELLEDNGFDVCGEASDGEEAVRFAGELEPDLAIFDVKMPVLDGIDAARRVLDVRPIPILILTGYGQSELVARAAEAGVYGYLVKPFREQDLLPAIRTAQARHEELTAVRGEAESLAEGSPRARRSSARRASSWRRRGSPRARRLRACAARARRLAARCASSPKR
jgi:AmiR/NasT family two-component response regulator